MQVWKGSRISEILVGAVGIEKTTILTKSHKIEALQPLLSRQSLQTLQKKIDDLSRRRFADVRLPWAGEVRVQIRAPRPKHLACLSQWVVTV